MQNSSRLEAEIDKKTHTFEQGVARVSRLFQNPRVKGQPRHFAVNEAFARWQILGQRGRSGRAARGDVQMIDHTFL